jgi:hypothetical protein
LDFLSSYCSLLVLGGKRGSGDEAGRPDRRNRVGEEHRVQPLQGRRRPHRRRRHRCSGKHAAALVVGSVQFC